MGEGKGGITAQLHTPDKNTQYPFSRMLGSPGPTVNILRIKITSPAENQTLDHPPHRLVTLLIMIYQINLPMSFITERERERERVSHGYYHVVSA
jgi:hypothetical protein